MSRHKMTHKIQQYSFIYSYYTKQRDTMKDKLFPDSLSAIYLMQVIEFP